MARASDEELLTYATEHGLVMVSKDADFTRLHGEWQAIDRKHGGVIKVPRGLEGEALIATLVTELMFYYEAEAADTIDYSTEIQDRLIFL